MQKLLFGLTIIWLALTINLAVRNHLFQLDAEDQLQRRAFIVYSKTLTGCIIGSLNITPNYPFEPMYGFCRNLAFSEKAYYLERSK